MSDGGKGSKPRPLSVDKETFDNNWDTIFGNRENDYQDILSTEDCMLESLEKIKNGNESNNSI
jgi:hypothetical protein